MFERNPETKNPYCQCRVDLTISAIAQHIDLNDHTIGKRMHQS